MDDLIRGQTSADDVQLEDFSQFLLVGQQSIQIVLAEPAEGFVGRGQQRQLAGARDALHEVGCKVLHDAVEFVQDPVALLLRT